MDVVRKYIIVIPLYYEDGARGISVFDWATVLQAGRLFVIPDEVIEVTQDCTLMYLSKFHLLRHAELQQLHILAIDIIHLNASHISW
jgi:hypothetical protein